MSLCQILNLRAFCLTNKFYWEAVWNQQKHGHQKQPQQTPITKQCIMYMYSIRRHVKPRTEATSSIATNTIDPQPHRPIALGCELQSLFPLPTGAGTWAPTMDMLCRWFSHNEASFWGWHVCKYVVMCSFDFMPWSYIILIWYKYAVKSHTASIHHLFPRLYGHMFTVAYIWDCARRPRAHPHQW